MALTLSLRYDTKTRVRTPPGPGDMPFAVIDVTISIAGGNAYPVGGEPVNFGPTGAAPSGIALFQEVHALIPTPLIQPTGVGLADPIGIFVPAFERFTTTTGVLRFYRAPGAVNHLVEFPGATAYSTAWPNGVGFTILVMGRPLTDQS